MRARLLLPALSVCLAAPVSITVAQPKGAPKKGPAAPAKDPAPKDAPAPGTPPAGPPAPGTGAGGEVVQMSEDAPAPPNLDGRDENPDAPRVGDEPVPTVEKPAAPKRTGYPIEEALRPITLTKNMAEVAIGPHAQLSPYQGADALRARYGITDKVQLGLTYMLGGIYDDQATMSEKLGFHPGKAVGFDVTVMLKDWVGVRLGVPVYIDPFAAAISLAAPMKWQFAGGKYAIGVLDDFLQIRVKRFVPSFYQEAANALAASGTGSTGNQTIQSRGEIRFSGYGVMQYQPKLAFTGRISVVLRDFSTTRTNASDNSGIATAIRAGLQYTPRKYLDLGFSVGFDDLSRGGSFAPAGLLAVRI